MSQRLGLPDPSRFPSRLLKAHVLVLPAGSLLGRIHTTAGSYPTSWQEFRFFGPTGSRFDHQPPPRRVHPVRGILYAATASTDAAGDPVPVLRTCLAEVFQTRQIVDLSRDAPFYVLFRSTRALRLLDLADSDWVTRAGGNAAISSGLRATARQWSRAIYRAYPTLDGIQYPCSQVPPARSIALYERAQDAIPARPQVHLPLTHGALRPEIEIYADELGLGLLL